MDLFRMDSSQELSEDKYFFDQATKTTFIYCLLIQGFSARIIHLATGFSPKRIRKIRSELLNRDHKYFEHAKKSKAIKMSSSKTLITTTEDRIRATILMSIYTRMRVNYNGRIDCIQIAKSFGIFLNVLKSEPSFAVENKIKNVNDAWSLAEELRGGKAWFNKCFACNRKFLESSEQSRNISSGANCPWCKFEHNHEH